MAQVVQQLFPLPVDGDTNVYMWRCEVVLILLIYYLVQEMVQVGVCRADLTLPEHPLNPQSP